MAVALLKGQVRKRKFDAALRDQMDRERNGEPIHPEIAQRMTKVKPPTVMYQVFVDAKGREESMPISPKWDSRDAAEMFLTQVNAQMCLGKLPTWGNARIEPSLGRS